jgi:hypothetical protein
MSAQIVEGFEMSSPQASQSSGDTQEQKKTLHWRITYKWCGQPTSRVVPAGSEFDKQLEAMLGLPEYTEIEVLPILEPAQN